MKFEPEIQFGAWLPDQPERQNPGCLIAKNVIPQIKGYRSLNSLVSFSDALSDVCLGSIWAQDDSNNVFNFAGDTDALYRLSGSNAWVDVSGTSAPYGATNWEFVKFGERIIAASYVADLQYFDMGSSSVFADLPGTPPRGSHIAVVRDFIVLGDTDINGGGGGTDTGPSYIQWSGFNNSQLWTPSLATQSDFQELRGKGGRIQRIVPGEYGLIFQEHSIRRMDYVGPPVVFQIDEVEPQTGTPAGNSVSWSGRYVYYFGWDGFYEFTGAQSENISHGKTSRTLISMMDATALSSMRSVVDRLNRLVIWAFKSSASSVINDRLAIYDRVSKRWSYAEVNTQVLAEFVSSGYSLEDLDTLFADIDSESINVDSAAYQGGGLNIQAFDSDNKSATFSSAALTAVLETREESGKDGRFFTVNKVRPLVEAESGGATTTVQIGHREKLQHNVSYTLAQSLNSYDGEADFRLRDRYMRYRLNIDSGFKHATGVKIRGRIQAGRRA